MTAITGVKNLIKEGVEDMTVKVWNEKRATELYLLRERYNIPLEVIEEARRIAKCLNAIYNSKRDIKNDDGGFVLLLLPDSNMDETEILYCELFEEYGLRYGTAEMEDFICSHGGVEWFAELYLTTNDYGITVIYPKENHM